MRFTSPQASLGTVISAVTVPSLVAVVAAMVSISVSVTVKMPTSSFGANPPAATVIDVPALTAVFDVIWPTGRLAGFGGVSVGTGTVVVEVVVGAVVAVVVEVVVAAGAGAGGAVVGAPTPRRGRRGAYDPDQRDDISHYERRRTLMGD